jgi:hypothetical protein
MGKVIEDLREELALSDVKVQVFKQEDPLGGSWGMR